MVYAYPKSVRIQSSTSWEWIWQGTPSWQMTAWVKIAVVAWFKLRIVQHNRSWGYRIQSPALSMTTYGSRRLLEGIEYGDSVRCIYCVYINPAVNYGYCQVFKYFGRMHPYVFLPFTIFNVFVLEDHRHNVCCTSFATDNTVIFPPCRHRKCWTSHGAAKSGQSSVNGGLGNDENRPKMRS